MDATSADTSAPTFMLPPEPETPPFSEVAFNEYFGLLSNEDLVIIRPYMGDGDDRVLEELRPKYIVMYDPNPAFVRRVEVRFSLLRGGAEIDSVAKTGLSGSASTLGGPDLLPPVQGLGRGAAVPQPDPQGERCVRAAHSGEGGTHPSNPVTHLFGVVF